MKLIKPSYEIWEQKSGLDGIYKAIERAGRVCYKSEDKITKNSAKEFVDRMIKLGHGAMLEHGTMYMKIPYGVMDDAGEFANEFIVERYIDNSYSVVNNNIIDDYWYVTSNFRVLIEHNWLNDLEYLCEPTEFHEKRITVKFILSRSIAQEFTRHRVFSFAMESQRYCNYSKDKFGNEITFILPPWIDELQLGEQNSKELIIQIGNLKNPSYYPQELSELYFLSSLASSELQYFNLLHEGWKPQQAREVLPNACKTELVMTGFISQWKEFFKLRDDSKAHPQAQELAKPLHEEFIKRGYIIQ